jgi:predicted DNA binding protein
MLGRSIGSAVNAVGSKRLISTDTVVAVTVDLTAAEAFPFRLAAAADCELAYETSRYDPDGEFVGLFTVRGTDPERVCEIAAEDDHIVDTRILAETDDGAVVQFRLPDASLVRLLADYGAHLEDLTANGAAGRLSFEASDETSARALVERLEDSYGAELAAYREGAPDQPTIKEFQSAVEERLTDRQSTALRRAYASGFFAWPRDVDGERLAEAMGVSPPTFHQHLRAAQRKVFAELFDA